MTSENSISAKKKYPVWMYLISFLLPVIFFLFLEGALRLFGIGESIPVFIEVDNHPEYLVINPNLGKRYFFKQDFVPGIARDIIKKDKNQQIFRVFILGGSSTAGFPYFHNGSFSRMVRAHFQLQFPEKKIEIANFGMTAVNSFALLDFADELPQYQPDAILIYAGHNEFYGSFGAASTERISGNRTIINTYLKLQKFRTFQLIQQLIHKTTTLFKSTHDAPRGTLMKRMVGEKYIGVNDKIYQQARDNFRLNLEEIVRLFANHKIPVFMGSVVSIEKDLIPFISFSSQKEKEQQIKQNLSASWEYYKLQQYEEALREIKAAEELDSTYALSHYIKAQCLYQLGKFQEAKKEFVLAKDYDGLKFRAPSEWNDIIKQICDSYDNCFYVPVYEEFEKESEHGIPDNSLLLEHVHPNLSGQALIARTFIDHIGHLLNMRISDREADLNQLSLQAGVTEVDEQIGRIALKILLSDWPFKRNPSSEETVIDYNPDDYIKKLALDIYTEKISWKKGHFEASKYYKKNNQLYQAYREFLGLLNEEPYNVSAYIEAITLLFQLEKFDDAYPLLKHAELLDKKRNETHLIFSLLGAYYLWKHNLDEGIKYLKQALQINPKDLKTIFNLAGAYYQQQNFRKSLEYIHLYESYAPDDTRIKQMKEAINKITSEERGH
ncbi:MAG: hypothetical protein Kow00108_25000 [Calditrichia bacterium]